MYTYKIADKSIRVLSLYNDVHEYCHEYRCNEEPDFDVVISQKDIDFERVKSVRERLAEGVNVVDYPDAYIEELAVYRKIAETMPKYHTFLFHGSAIAVTGIGYIFAAPSGTGKSTHAYLWCKLLGDKVVMVNDDKPLISIKERKAMVHGTPFNGKHRRGSNISVPLKAICLLERSKSNHILRIPYDEAYTELLRQIYRPLNPDALRYTIRLLDELKTCVTFYRMGCNMDIEAAELAYKTMKEECT